MLASNFGDAPSPFPVTLADNGARHEVGTLWLGDPPDTESDGTNSSGSDHDDNNGDDENGIGTTGIFYSGQDNTIIVSVQGTAGKLDGWIDFNDDGSWEGEKVFDSIQLGVGVHELPVFFPSEAESGRLTARFRLSTQGNLDFTGPAADGEVEDRWIFNRESNDISDFFLESEFVTFSISENVGIDPVDLDGDGDLDIIGVAQGDNLILWYENDGSQNFTVHTVGSTIGRVTDVAASDLDGDGDLDLAVGGLFGNDFTWWENDGAQNFTEREVVASPSSIQALVTADLDGDGDQDVIATVSNNAYLVWFQNNGNQTFTRRSIAADSDFFASSLAVDDMDGDGDLDIVTGSTAGFSHKQAIRWHENQGNGAFNIHSFGGTQRVVTVFTADIDGDGDQDVLTDFSGDPNVGSSAVIEWHENDGSGAFVAHGIDSPTTLVFSVKDVFAADIDQDGDMDIVAASPIKEGFISDEGVDLFINNGNEVFSGERLGTARRAPNNIFPADIDDDGDLDVVSATDTDIVWYSQQHAPIFTSPTSASVLEETQEVLSLLVTDTDSAAAGLTFAFDGQTIDNSKFEIVNGNELRFKVAPDFDNPSDIDRDNVYEVKVLAFDGDGQYKQQTIMVTVTDDMLTEVLTRNVFYNDSSFDMVAGTKTPLLNGQIASFNNYSSYSKGINGIDIFTSELAATPTLATVQDFLSFAIGNSDTPAQWQSAPDPIGLVYDENVNSFGHDRIRLTWADNAIEKTWLQVNVLANGLTGLASQDTFYFGNAPGETGNDSANAIVNLIDVALTRSNQTGFGSADIDNVYDFDRDGRVNLVDVAIARGNQSGFTPLNLIDLTSVGGRSSLDGGSKAKNSGNRLVQKLVSDPALLLKKNDFPISQESKKELAHRDSLAEKEDIFQIQWLVSNLGDAASSSEVDVEARTSVTVDATVGGFDSLEKIKFDQFAEVFGE